MAFAGHVLRGSSGKDLLDVLEGKLNYKLSQGRPRRMWLDDIKSWTGLDPYDKIKNLATTESLGEPAALHVNLLIQKKTADDDDDSRNFEFNGRAHTSSFQVLCITGTRRKFRYGKSIVVTCEAVADELRVMLTIPLRLLYSKKQTS